MFARILMLLSGLFGATGVALGAFGAHALKAQLAASGHTDTWNKAVSYQLIHAVAALAISFSPDLSGAGSRSRWLTVAATFWLAGVLFFSGSLYALSFDAPRWLGPVTPLGGILLIAGWICVLVAGLKKNIQ